MVQGGTSGVVDEPIWISYEDLESVAAPSGKCRRQKPQRFIRAFRALHISRSSTRLSPSDPSRSASPRFQHRDKLICVWDDVDGDGD